MAANTISLTCDRCGTAGMGKVGVGPTVPEGWISLGCAALKIVPTQVVLCSNCFGVFAAMMKAGSEKFEFQKPPQPPATVATSVGAPSSPPEPDPGA